MRVAIYCRVSNHDPDCEAQEQKLTDYAINYGCKIVDVWKESRFEYKQRKAIMKLAEAGDIDSVFVTELSQWGRSVSDLAQTIRELHGFDVSLFCLDGFNCDSFNSQGAIVLGMVDLLGKFEDELLSEQTIFERSFGNIFSNVNWFTLKLCINSFFAIISTSLAMSKEPDAVLRVLYAAIASIFISNLMNSCDLLVAPKFKRQLAPKYKRKISSKKSLPK